MMVMPHRRSSSGQPTVTIMFTASLDLRASPTNCTMSRGIVLPLMGVRGCTNLCVWRALLWCEPGSRVRSQLPRQTYVSVVRSVSEYHFVREY